LILAVIIMQISTLLPKRFSTRLIVMTFISGLIPIIIFTLLMNIFDDRFLTKINRAIQQGQKEQWQRSEAVLRQMAEDFIRRKALDVALQLELYLQAHPAMTVEDLQHDPKFREMAVQPVGKTGYTAVHDSATAINRFHRNTKVENLVLLSLSPRLPNFGAIIEASLDGRYSHGYYQWKEPNGDLRDKFMYIVPLSEKTAEGVRFGVAATTYIDEFTRSIKAAQDVSHSTARYLVMTANGLIESFRITGFLFMGIGVALVLALACWAGIYFSRAITHLREATRAVNQGDFGIRLKRIMSGDVGELIEDFNQMTAQLATTTVKKEQLEASEKKLKTTNEKLHREITERKRAEEGLTNALKELEDFMNAIPDIAYKVKPDLSLANWNRAAEEISGYSSEEISRKNALEFIAKEDHAKVAETIQEVYEKGLSEVEAYLITKDGRKIPYLLSGRISKDSEGNITSIAGVAKDLTKTLQAEDEKKNLEAQLQRARKMESLGLMAGGIAHDLNNILSGIVSYPELLLMDLPADSPLRKPIEIIMDSGYRAVDVVSDLLTVARGVALGKEVLNMNNIIEEYFRSAEYKKLETMNLSITFKTQLDPDLLKINCSPIHIKKSLMNLVANASEAIEGRGTVVVTTMSRYLDEPLKGYEDVYQGEYALLTVSDDGSGISPEDLERIFEPFYTKKVIGRSGTGLGLPIVWNTVQDHNGYINVKSSDNGTIFELYFPATRDEVTVGEEKVPFEDYVGHKEKILVVDDEENQRKIACGLLTKLGYNAEAVSSGEEAIEYLTEHSVDLIVLDMIMPKGMNGRETYGEITKIHPNQKAIIASGLAETEEVKEAQKLGAGEYIKKPYTLEKVGIAVRDELKKCCK